MQCHIHNSTSYTRKTQVQKTNPNTAGGRIGKYVNHARVLRGFHFYWGRSCRAKKCLVSITGTCLACGVRNLSGSNSICVRSLHSFLGDWRLCYPVFLYSLTTMQAAAIFLHLFRIGENHALTASSMILAARSLWGV